MTTNLDINNMANELRKHYKSITNKNYIKDSLKYHKDYKFITQQEYKQLYKEYI